MDKTTKNILLATPHTIPNTHNFVFYKCPWYYLLLKKLHLSIFFYYCCRVKIKIFGRNIACIPKIVRVWQIFYCNLSEISNFPRRLQNIWKNTWNIQNFQDDTYLIGNIRFLEYQKFSSNLKFLVCLQMKFCICMV